jgi:hypothetical protein
MWTSGKYVLPSVKLSSVLSLAIAFWINYEVGLLDSLFDLIYLISILF